MQSLNQLIKIVVTIDNMSKIKQSFIFLLLALNFFLSTSKVYSQAKLEIPSQFSNASTNSKALSKTIDFELSKDTNGSSQNFILDKTGVFLHLVPSPKIKENSTSNLKVFSEDGEEVKLYKFIDGTFFSLVDPEKSYSIVQELKIDCKSLTGLLSLDETKTICPTKELFKLYEGIKISSDTSFKINLTTPSEFYLLKATSPQDISLVEKDKFTLFNIATEDKIEEDSGLVNISNLLLDGEVCIVGYKPAGKNSKPSKCTFTSKNTNSVLSFKDSFIDKPISGKSFDIVFSYPPRKFNLFSYGFLFNLDEEIKSSNAPIEITDPNKGFFFENNTSSLSLNLGDVSKKIKKVKKNLFNLEDGFQINKDLNRFVFSVPTDNLNPIITFEGKNTFNAVLDKLSFVGKNISQTSTFNATTKNNIIIKDLVDEPDNKKSTQTKAQISSNLSPLFATIFLPEEIFNSTFSRTYTYVEKSIGPSVDEKGKAIEVINNKSLAELTISKDYPSLDTKLKTLFLSFKRPSLLLSDKSFATAGSLTGFLVAPDLRPVLEDNYRETINFSTQIKLEEEIINASYSDLQTKDETKLTDFFNFLYMPFGKYKVTIKFDKDRDKLFGTYGLIVKPKDSSGVTAPLQQ